MNRLASSHRVAAMILVLPLLFVLSIQDVQAQGRWLRTVEIVAPVTEDLATQPLLDTLVDVAQRQDLQFRRSPAPEHAQPMSFNALQDRLLNDGLDATSANRVFVTYRFEADNLGFSSTVESLYFIYRPEMSDDTDIPIFLVDGKDPVVHRILTQKGTQLRVNEAAFKPFMEQIKFTNLINESVIVRLGDEIIRDEGVAADEKRRLLQTIRGFMY